MHPLTQRCLQYVKKGNEILIATYITSKNLSHFTRFMYVCMHPLTQRCLQYVKKGNEILIVDEFTGRVLEGRRWSNGLHQSVEAKEVRYVYLLV